MDVLHTSFFCMIFINFNSLVPPRNKSVYPVFALIWTLHSQPLLNFFNNLLITSKPLALNGIYKGSTEVEIWGSKILAVWRVGKNIPSHLCDCFLYFQTCVWSCIVTLNDNFRKIFVRLNSPEMLLQGFKSLIVQIWVNGLTIWQMSSKITLSASQKTVTMAFPVEWVALNFFHGEFGWGHSSVCLSVSSSKWWIHVSPPPVTIPDKKLSPSAS